MPAGAKQTVRFGPFELDEQCGQLRKDGLGLKLQGQPIQILEILLEHPGELVSREQLRERLWASDTFVDFDHSLNTAIKKLRQTLGDEAEMPRYIETLPKRGYRFVAEAKRDGSVETRAPEPPPRDPLETRSERESPPEKRWSRSKAVVIVGACFLAALAASVSWLLRSIPQPRIVASHALTETGSLKRGKLLSDGRSVYFGEYRGSDIVLMQVSVNGGEVVQVSTPVALAVGSLTAIAKDGSEILICARRRNDSVSDIWSVPIPAGSPRLLVRDCVWAVWTADGRSLLYKRGEQLYRANRDGTNELALAKFEGEVDIAPSPDGRRLRFGVPRFRATWETAADGSNPHPILQGHQDGSFSGLWTPDGKYYFFRSWDGSRYNLWAIRDSSMPSLRDAPKPVQLTFGPFSIEDNLGISKDGKQIYSITTEAHGELSIYDPKGGSFVRYQSGIPACFVDFSRDRQWMTYVSIPEGNLWRSKLDGSERRQLTWAPFAVVNPRWSPDGKLIAFGDMSRETARIYVVSADGGQPMLLPTGNPGVEVGDPTWSPDGAAIVYSSGGPIAGQIGDVRVLDLHTQKSSKVPGSDGLWSPRWSPDGKHIVAFGGSPPSRLMMFTFATHEWKELTRGSWMRWPCWRRDSKQVFVFDNSQVVRIDVSNGRREVLADIGDFRPTTPLYFRFHRWFGIAPDGRPISTRDTSVQEIYAFDLEYK